MTKLKLRSKTESKNESPRKKILKKQKELVLDEKEDPNQLEFIPSGCYLLNLSLTGNIDKAYPIGRIVGFEGEYSGGKTELLLEAIAALYHIAGKKQGKKVLARFCDAESAMDKSWAESLGVPIDEVEWKNECETVEEFHHDLWKFINKNQKDYDILLYGLDSLDSLSDIKEKERIKKALVKFDKDLEKEEKRKKSNRKEEEDTGKEKEEKLGGSYGAEKAKYLSSFFRDLKTSIKKTNCLLIILYQQRDDLTKKYGDKLTTSGGKAKDYYGSQIIKVNKGEKLYKTKASKIPYGRSIHALVKKNKVYAEGRFCDYNLVFNHGIDNIGTMIDFLDDQKVIERNGAYYVWNGKNYFYNDLVNHFYSNREEINNLKKEVQEAWNEMEENCRVDLPPKWE